MKHQKIISIHSQLTLLYTACVISLLILISLAFYWETQSVMRQANVNFISEELNNIQSILNDNQMDMQLLKKMVVEHPQRAKNSLYRYYIRIYDEKGRIFMETPGMSPKITAVPVQKTSPTNEHFSRNSHFENNYLLLLAPVTDESGIKKRYVQIALDESHQHMITHDRKIYFGLLIFGILISILLSRTVTTRGLKRLDLLTDTIKKITANSLDQRLNTATLPKELNMLGEAFNQMLNRIEAVFIRLNQMSADMSHELRTPINNLIGQAELLLSCNHSEDDCRQAQASNLEELQRITSLVDNILFLARAEGQIPKLNTQFIDVENEIEKVCSYYQASAEDKNITMLQNGSANLHVNVVMFRRLINNLLSNAMKYTPENGMIRIIIRDEGKCVTVEIIDNGIGIDDQHIPRLFDRFYRVDNSRSKPVDGTGLGLSIVKSIIDLHHGSIHIDSETGKGTRIVVRFPK